MVTGQTQGLQHGFGALVHRPGGERGLLGEQAGLAGQQVAAGQRSVEPVPRQVDGIAGGTEAGQLPERGGPHWAELCQAPRTKTKAVRARASWRAAGAVGFIPAIPCGPVPSGHGKIRRPAGDTQGVSRAGRRRGEGRGRWRHGACGKRRERPTAPGVHRHGPARPAARCAAPVQPRTAFRATGVARDGVQPQQCRPGRRGAGRGRHPRPAGCAVSAPNAWCRSRSATTTWSRWWAPATRTRACGRWR